MFVRRLLFFIIGLFILALGISTMIEADLGAASWDALNVGLSETIGLTVGTWVLIVGVLLIFVNALLLKKRPDVLAVGTILLIGVFVDFWLILVLGDLELESFMMKLFVFILGLVFCALGIAIYLQAKFPLSPIDNLMVAISTRFKVSMRVAKTIAEATGFILALLFSGPIGIGTIICTLCLGPIIQFFFPFFEGLMEKGRQTSASRV